MIAYIPDAILKPVAAMTNKCGFNFPHQVSERAQEQSSTNWSATPASLKATKSMRGVSTTSTAVEDSVGLISEDSASDEEVCKRMAQLGRVARKAGRHVLVNGRLVLS